MKVYLVIKIIERGFAADEEPVAVYESKDDAKLVAEHHHAYVKELYFFRKER